MSPRRPFLFHTVLLVGFIALLVCVDSAQGSQRASAAATTYLTNNFVCFGAKNNNFATFTLPETLDVEYISMKYYSGSGVSCNAALYEETPFGCGGTNSVGFVCDFTGSSSALDISSGATLISTNQSSVPPGGIHAQRSTPLTLTVGQLLPKGTRCGIVYMEDWLNRAESDNNNGATCVTLFAATVTRGPLTTVEGIPRLVPSGAHSPQGHTGSSTGVVWGDRWAKETSGWVWSRFKVNSTVEMSWLNFTATPSSFTQTTLPQAASKIATSAHLQGLSVVYDTQRAAATVPSLVTSSSQQLTLVRWNGKYGLHPTSNVLSSICKDHSASASLASLPFTASQVTVGDPLRSLISRTDDASALTVTNDSVIVVEAKGSGSSSFVLVKLQSGVISKRGVTATELESLPVTPLVLCEQKPNGNDYQISATLPESCPNFLDELSCVKNPYCGWIPSTQRCCNSEPALEAVPPSIVAVMAPQHKERCPCDMATVTMDSTTQVTTDTPLVNPTCSSQRSLHTVPSLITLVCSTYSTTKERHTCREQYSRCRSRKADPMALISAALSRRCAMTSFRECLDAGQACTVVTPQPTAVPTQAPTPIPIEPLPYVGLRTNSPFFTAEQIQNGSAYIHFLIDQQVTAWNFTKVLDPGAPLTEGLFEANDVKFGFSEDVFQPNATARISDYEFTLRLGPYKRYLPVTFEETVNFTIPKDWLQRGVVADLPSVLVTITGPKPDPNYSKAVTVVLIITTVLYILSGPGGWIGISALQNFLLAVSSPCAEPFTREYFDTAGYFVAVPTLFVDDASNRFVFYTLIGILGGVLALHVLAALFHFRIIAPHGSFRMSSFLVYFPMPFLYFTTVSFIAISKHAYTGVIDDRTPYVRVVFAFSWLFFCLVFLTIWYEGIRRGHDGYFLKYREAVTLIQLGKTTSNEDDEKYYNTRCSRFRAWIIDYVRRFFTLQGSWPLTTAWGVLRGLTNDRASYFTLIYLIFMSASGINASHEGNAASFCYAFYWNMSAIFLLLALVSLFFQPFRLPCFNFLWIVTHFVEFAFTANSAQYVFDDDPHSDAVNTLPMHAFGILCIHLVMALISFTITFVEEVLRQSHKKLQEHREKDRGLAGDHHGQADTELPLLDMAKISGSALTEVDLDHDHVGEDRSKGGPAGSLSASLLRRSASLPGGGAYSYSPPPRKNDPTATTHHKASVFYEGYGVPQLRHGFGLNPPRKSPSPPMRGNPLYHHHEQSNNTIDNNNRSASRSNSNSQPQQEGDGKPAGTPCKASIAEQQRHQLEEQRRAELRMLRRVVIELRPVPPGSQESDLMLLFEMFAAMDILIVGDTAFIGVRGEHMAAAAMSTFNNRMLHGALVELKVVNEDFSAKEDAAIMRSLTSPGPLSKTWRDLL